MSLLRIFVRHFAHPAGFWGRVVAFRLDISNRQANEWTVSLLDLHPTDRVLEVGYGSGLTLQSTARRVPQGFVAGVDSSQTMFEIARKRNVRCITAGRMALYLGSMEALNFPDNHFDKAYAVQVINYLPDLLQGLIELRRVIKPGGRVALFFEAKEKFERIQGLIEGIYRPYDPAEVVAALKQASFARTWFEKKEFVDQKVHYTGLVALGERQ